MTTSISFDQFEQFHQMMRLGRANGCAAQALEIMTLLRHAVAPTVEMALLEAWQLIAADRLPEARRVLEEAEQSDPGHSEVKAVLAAVLFFAEDNLWHRYAFEVEQAPEPDEVATNVVARLKAASESGLSVTYLRSLMLQPLPAQPVPETAPMH
jgi:hypothetical protein